MFKPCWMVAAVCVTLSGPAVADIINVPGAQPTIQAGIDAAVTYNWLPRGLPVG